MDTNDLYLSYKAFVAKRAYHAVQKYGITNQFEDAFQEASVAFVMAARKFDADKGTIVNIAWTTIDRHLRRWAKRQSKYINSLIADDSWSVSDDDSFEIPFDDGSYKLADLKSILTDEEEYLVRLALSSLFSTKGEIVCEMKKKGWSRYKTLKHCSSIRSKIEAIA